MKNKKIKKSGFSLIEVLFTVLFVSVIVFGVIRLQTSHLVLDNTQKNFLKANFYVNQGLDIVSSLNAQVWGFCGTDCVLKKNGQNYTMAPNPVENLDNGLFHRSFQKVSDGLVNGAYLFTATVAWTDSTGEHKVTGKRVAFD